MSIFGTLSTVISLNLSHWMLNSMNYACHQILFSMRNYFLLSFYLSYSPTLTLWKPIGFWSIHIISFWLECFGLGVIYKLWDQQLLLVSTIQWANYTTQSSENVLCWSIPVMGSITSSRPSIKFIANFSLMSFFLLTHSPEDVQERTHTHLPMVAHFLFGKSEF